MSKTVKVTRGATLGLDLTEDWNKDSYSAEDARARRLEWKQLDAAIDARHAAIAAERAERETADAEREARRAAMRDAASSLNVSADELRDALRAERDALLIAQLEDAERKTERSENMQVFTRHTVSAEAREAAREAMDAARRSSAYVAASILLSALPRRTNAVLTTKPGAPTIYVSTVETVSAPSRLLPNVMQAIRAEAEAVSIYDSRAAEAETEARLSRDGTASRVTAQKLIAAEREATRATRHALASRAEWKRAMQAATAVNMFPVPVMEIPLTMGNALNTISVSELFPYLEWQAREIANNVPVRNDVHPFPTKLGRGNVTGTTQATKPGTRLNLATRDSKIVDPFDSVAEAKREARRARDAKRTGQTVKNRATARAIALSDFHTGLALMEAGRAHNDARQVAAERDAERRAERARQRRAAMTAEDKAARNLHLRNKRRAAKNK